MTKRNYSRLIWLSLLAFCAYSQEQGYVSAKKLFYADVQQPGPGKNSGKTSGKGGVKTIPTSATVAGLRYAVIQEVEPGREVTVDPAKEFHSGDRVRFEFESNLEGYLYVTQEGSSGMWNVLFPDARINSGTNHVQKRLPYSVPARPKYFVFNDVPGNEKVMVVLCKSPVKDLPAEAKPSPQTVDQNVINELNSSLKTRDLVFEKDEGTGSAPVATVPTASTVPTGSTFVVNRNENGQAVVVTISLKHVR
jgi:hypothetical protein